MMVSPAAAQLRPHHTCTSSPTHAHNSITPTRKRELRSRRTTQCENAVALSGGYASKDGRGQLANFKEIISRCISNKDLREGQRLRSAMRESGYRRDTFLDNQFINLYAKCGEIAMAREVFDSMAQRNVFSWNVLLAGYCSNGCFLDAAQLFCAMVDSGEAPNNVTCISALRASVGLRSLSLGKQIHSQAIKSGCFGRAEVGNVLINMYSELGQPGESEAVFDSMMVKDLISWNSLITAKVKGGYIDEGIELCVEMQREGDAPDEFTYLSLLRTDELDIVKQIHAQLTLRGLLNGVVIGSALLDAYARLSDIQSAMKVFNSMESRNIITWNSILDACVESDILDEGLRLFLEMQKHGLAPDEYTISVLLKAATRSSQSSLGMQIHGLAEKIGLNWSTMIGNGLISMYAKHGKLQNSERAFNTIRKPDPVSWNSMAQSYIQTEEFEKALSIFIGMKHAGIRQDEFSFVSAVAACTSLEWHGTGKAVHGDLIKRGMSSNAFVGCRLIDMYADSFTINDARKVFDGIKYKDVITWNSVISAFAQSGDLHQVLNFLGLMTEEMDPDDFTFATVLAASANSAAVQLGMQIHAMILKSELRTDTAVVNALISMYSKAGFVKEAHKVFSGLTCKNVISWTAMIGGFAQNGCFQEAFDVFDAHMQDSKVMPNEETFIELLTACSHANKTSKAAEYLEMMQIKYGIQPTPDHYACMVDMLGRAGRLREAEDLIKGMPFEADALIWKVLLSSCRIHGDLERGKRCMDMILALEPADSGAYVLLSNLYATSGNRDSMLEIRHTMRINGVRKEPGKSWIELQNKTHEFVAGDSSHPETHEIYSVLVGLSKQMRTAKDTPLWNGIMD